MYLIFIFILVLISVYLFTSSFLINMKLLEYEGKIQNVIEKRKNKSFLVPVLLKRADSLGKLILKIDNKKLTRYLTNISKGLNNLGGSYSNTNSAQFLALQIFCALAGALFSVFFISTSVFSILFFMFISFLLPLIKMKEDIKKKKELIFKQLPDTADLLSVMLDSGLDFFAALNKVTEILKGPLSDELKSASSKIALGYDKKKALLEIVEKTEVEQLNFFVKTINMALDAGVGMADTLKRLAKQLRTERAMDAEKRAQEAPVKMLIPLVLFIFPTIFIVIFGPIVINLVKTGGF